jgi:amidohydrolase
MFDLVSFRKYLHQNPELSGAEYETQKYLIGHLEKLGLNYTKLANTGLLISFKTKEAGKSLLIRADMDALAIQEEGNSRYASKNKGVSHKCGHDGHMTVLMALVYYFSEQPLKAGSLHLLFQPSEEDGKGAASVLRDPKFQLIHYDRAYAFHNIPGFKLGEVFWRNGNFTAGVRSLIFRFKGYSSHAAEPEKARSPQALLAKAMQSLEKLANPYWEKEDFSQISLVHARLGEAAYGITPGKGELHYTIRAWKGPILDALEEKMHQQLKEWADLENLKIEKESLPEFWPNFNSAAAKKAIIACADEQGIGHHPLEEAFRWGEDFGLFLKDKEGALFGIGAGEEHLVLHHPAYDFPDAILKPTISLFKTLILNYLNGKY